jgi:hypothetical protein
MMNNTYIISKTQGKATVHTQSVITCSREKHRRNGNIQVSVIHDDDSVVTAKLQNALKE